jgi:ABC-type nitrate/sulfonate/bicarbonate transport system substrate-binding protein
VAAQSGLGFVAIRSRGIWRDHPEKCLALRADFAARDPAALLALLQVLRAASALCADENKRAGLAALLARSEYLDLPAGLIEAGLDPEAGGPLFTRQYPSAAQARWYAGQMLRWGKAPREILDVPGAMYRPDLFIAAGGEEAAPQPSVFCDKTSFLDQ